MSSLDLTSVDNSTAALILQHQIEELEHLTARSKGKARIDQPSDADITLQLYKSDLDRWSAIITDRAMARSVVSVVTNDPELTACEEEMGAGLDALRGDLFPVEEEEEEEEGKDDNDLIDDMLRKLRVLSADDGEAEVKPSSSRSYWKGPSPGRHIECEVCGESKPFFDATELPCGHQYCRECLQQVYEASIADESLFSPRCYHQPMAMKDIQPFLTTHIFKRYLAWKQELETADRTYCCSPACSLFISPDLIVNDQAACTNCGKVTVPRTLRCRISFGQQRNMAGRDVILVVESLSWIQGVII